MSKTAQRKRQAYEEGRRDGFCGYGKQYARHPFMPEYMRGLSDGKSQACKPETFPQSVFVRLAGWLSKWWAK